jgi:hypothetical protein
MEAQPITPMEAYATTDGRLFTDTLEAQAHQYSIDITPEVEEHLGIGFIYTMNGYVKKNAILEWEVARKLEQLKKENHNDLAFSTIPEAGTC